MKPHSISRAPYFVTRRAWLTRNVVTAAALMAPRRPSSWSYPSAPSEQRGVPSAGHAPNDTDQTERIAIQAARLDPGPWQALAVQAVDAARTAGAHYADARLTRIVRHFYQMPGNGQFSDDTEEVGVGVRVLVNGYWGFAASPFWTPDEVVRLARDAVAQARANAKGPPRSVDLGEISRVTGTWTTPLTIDPFTIPIEEKLDAIAYWTACAARAGVSYDQFGWTSYMLFARQERVVATSEGSLFTQTCYESGGQIKGKVNQGGLQQGVGAGGGPAIAVQDIDVAGKGWELFLEAKIPEQFAVRKTEALQHQAAGQKPATIGRYTLVCDGKTMASFVDKTIGVATQLDRALGYEANAGGTSFIDDPLAMVGHLPVTAPSVTITANRSAPSQLATVQWDDEGVVAKPFTLVKDGVLTDFQTTREQAAWLASYYRQQGIPVRSHGCAAAQDAHGITLQMMPNLALEPSAAATRLADLVADVTEGILIEDGQVWQVDFQARNGLLSGSMREIKNGRLGRQLKGGAVQFETTDFWKHVTTVAGAPTQAVRASSQYLPGGNAKGQPTQQTSNSVSAVAALITNQPVIDPARKV